MTAIDYRENIVRLSEKLFLFGVKYPIEYEDIEPYDTHVPQLIAQDVGKRGFGDVGFVAEAAPFSTIQILGPGQLGECRAEFWKSVAAI